MKSRWGLIAVILIGLGCRGEVVAPVLTGPIMSAEDELVKIEVVEVFRGDFRTLQDGKVIALATKDFPDMLSVHLRVTNKTESKKLSLYGFSSTSIREIRSIKAVDDLNNNYAAFDTRPKNTSLYPGKSIDIILHTQPPVDKAKWMTIGLPRGGYSEQEGNLVLRVPAKHK